jgi:hypothetical protein
MKEASKESSDRLNILKEEAEEVLLKERAFF